MRPGDVVMDMCYEVTAFDWNLGNGRRLKGQATVVYVEEDVYAVPGTGIAATFDTYLTRLLW